MRAIFIATNKINRDMTGWECVEPAQAKEGEFEPVLKKLLRRGEETITLMSGEEMMERAKKLGALTGIRHAEAMYRKRAKIPADMKEYDLIFPEAWTSRNGSLGVFRLHYIAMYWSMGFYWLVEGFSHSRCRIVVAHKVQK